MGGGVRGVGHERSEVSERKTAWMRRAPPPPLQSSSWSSSRFSRSNSCGAPKVSGAEGEQFPWRSGPPPLSDGR